MSRTIAGIGNSIELGRNVDIISGYRTHENAEFVYCRSAAVGDLLAAQLPETAPGYLHDLDQGAELFCPGLPSRKRSIPQKISLLSLQIAQ